MSDTRLAAISDAAARVTALYAVDNSTRWLVYVDRGEIEIRCDEGWSGVLRILDDETWSYALCPWPWLVITATARDPMRAIHIALRMHEFKEVAIEEGETLQSQIEDVWVTG